MISPSIPVFNLATGEATLGDSEWSWAIRGIFTRFNYNFDGRYFFEVNARYDGSSRFPSANRFAWFPSFSAGWRVSEEAFMRDYNHILSNLMLRASYGRLGNQNIGQNFPFIANFGHMAQVAYVLGGTRPMGFNPPGLAAGGDFTWETAATTNFGINLGLWNRLNISYDRYVRRTTNMLTAGETLPAVLGTAVPRRNNAELETHGWELTVRWADRVNRDFRYDVGFVLADNWATITRFDGNYRNLLTNWRVGQRVGEIWGFETVDIIRTEEQLAQAANHQRFINNPRLQLGDVEYRDRDGDGYISRGDNTSDNPGDLKIIGNASARFNFGITGNVQWRSFDANIFFQGVGKRDFVPTGNHFWGTRTHNMAIGTQETFQNAWRPENPDGFFPSYRQASGFNLQPQTRFLQSGAYIRLKNLGFGYTLPSDWMQRVAIERVRVFASGYNLWEATGIRGEFDPEALGGLGGHGMGVIYPLQRTVMMGVQVTL